MSEAPASAMSEKSSAQNQGLSASRCDSGGAAVMPPV
jgi:hypothetical protein